MAHQVYDGDEQRQNVRVAVIDKGYSERLRMVSTEEDAVQIYDSLDVLSSI